MQECNDEPFCRNCEGPHRPTSRQCEVYKTEADVIRTRIDFNLSYDDARKRVAAGNGSYAQVAAQPRLDQARFNALANQMQAKQDQIERLEKELSKKESIEDQLSRIIEQNNRKEETINELLGRIRERDETIAKLETQVENLKKLFDSDRKRSESLHSEPGAEESRRKSKRTTNQQQQQTRMSPPPKKATTSKRSPIQTRKMTSQATAQVVVLSDSEIGNDKRFRNHNPGSQ